MGRAPPLLLRAALLLLTLASCAGPPVAAERPITVLRFDPTGPSVPVESSITATLSQNAPEFARLRLFDPDGREVPGVIGSSGNALTFLPSGLDPGSSYAVRVDGEGVEPFAWTFTTERFGLPVEDLAELPGRTFAVTFGVPRAGGPDQDSRSWVTLVYLANGRLLFSALPGGLAKGALPVRVGSSAYDEELGPLSPSECAPRIELVGAFPNPALRVRGASVPLLAGYVVVHLLDLTFDGVFTPEGDGIEEATITLTVDTRELHEHFSPPGDEQICPPEFPCEPCDDGAPFCVSLDLVESSAVLVDDVSLEALSPADIAADPACD